MPTTEGTQIDRLTKAVGGRKSRFELRLDALPPWATNGAFICVWPLDSREPTKAELAAFEKEWRAKWNLVEEQPEAEKRAYRARRKAESA